MMDEANKDAIERVRDYLCGYQFCVDMLNLRKYERRRVKPFDDPCNCDDLLCGNELLWRSRMFEVQMLIDSMKNGREKLILYYHYIKGESIERAADHLGISRRTGYRLHQKGLFMASVLHERKEKNGSLGTV